MLSIAFHDRIGGTLQMVNATNELISYTQKHPGIAFKQKDKIAYMTLKDPSSIRDRN